MFTRTKTRKVPVQNSLRCDEKCKVQKRPFFLPFPHFFLGENAHIRQRRHSHRRQYSPISRAPRSTTSFYRASSSFEAHHRRLARWSILHAQNLASISNSRDKVDDRRRAKATVFPGASRRDDVVFGLRLRFKSPWQLDGCRNRSDRKETSANEELRRLERNRAENQLPEVFRRERPVRGRRGERGERSHTHIFVSNFLPSPRSFCMRHNRLRLSYLARIQFVIRQPQCLERKFEIVYEDVKSGYVALNKPFDVRLDTPRGWPGKVRFTPKFDGDASCEDFLASRFPNEQIRFCHQLDNATSRVLLCH